MVYEIGKKAGERQIVCERTRVKNKTVGAKGREVLVELPVLKVEREPSH